MKKHLFIYLVSLFISLASFGQNLNSDTLNKVDASGKKQGHWKKIVNDTLIYEGYFKNDKPVSQFKYYYGDKKIKAISQFSCDSKFCSTTIFYPSGKKEAEGFYVNSKKDSLWKYYSENDTLIAEEHYKNCVKNGVWKFYYSNGVINQEVTWVNGVRNGPWKMYYSDGILKSENKIVNNKTEGMFTYYYPSGKIFLTGLYKSGLKEGIWLQYNIEGAVELKEKYKNGVLLKSEDHRPPEDYQKPDQQDLQDLQNK